MLKCVVGATLVELADKEFQSVCLSGRSVVLFFLATGGDGVVVPCFMVSYRGRGEDVGTGLFRFFDVGAV